MDDTPVEQPGRPDMKPEAGQLAVVLVTLAILSEPVLRFVQINRPGELLFACVVFMVALVLAYLLWTGTPLFRLICAGFLGVAGGSRLLYVALTPWPGDYWSGLRLGMHSWFRRPVAFAPHEVVSGPP